MASAALQHCMGLFFTLLYILTAYLAPDTLFGALADYRVELIIAVLALFTSIPALQQNNLTRIPQTYALIGMWVAVLMSFVFIGLTRSAPEALLNFLPSTFAFFFVMLNCKTKRHLQMVIVVLLSASLFSIYMGYTAILSGNFISPYLYTGHDTATTVPRLRGLSFINDPNDFAQLIVSLIPCLFFFWAPKRFPRNFIFVLVPAGILLFGMFLTHSRGGILAFLAVVVAGSRRKIGTIPSAIIAAVLFAIATVIGWSGGRDISVEQGADRMEAWSTGLQLLKSHPVFGVGFQRFTEYYVITAHNTIVVCATELGMFGLFFWVMFLIPTIRDAVVTGATDKSKEQLTEEEEEKTPFERALSARAAQAASMQFESATSATKPTNPALSGDARGNVAAMANPYFMNEEVSKELPEAEIRRLARLMVVSFIGFLVAGWFLSRAYVMTLFIYGGMVQVLYRMAFDQGLVPERMKLPRVMRFAAIGSVALIAVVYVMLRVQNLMRH
jgi:O-Antigen ligase